MCNKERPVGSEKPGPPQINKTAFMQVNHNRLSAKNDGAP